MAKKTTDAAPANRRKATSPRRAATAPPTTTTSADTAAAAPPAPSADEIAQAAYLRYLSRGGGDGQDFEDWLEAERELKTRGNGG